MWSMEREFGTTSVQLKVRFQEKEARKRRSAKHLWISPALLEGRRSIQLSYGRYVDSKRFPVSTTILKCHFAVVL
jgi:predicted secreted protein